MNMWFYQLLLVVHVIAAIVGIGAAFVFPVVSATAKTKEQLLWTHDLLFKLERFPKIAGILLILTGFGMAFIKPYLWKEGWFWTSIALYVIIQIIVIGLLMKPQKQQVEILNHHAENDIPATYLEISKKVQPLFMMVHALAIIIIILMVLKPF